MEAYQLSDEERVELALINGATKGDNETLGELFDRYQPLVRRLWLNYSIANLDRQDWQQEAFLVLDRAVHNYRQEQRTRYSPTACATCTGKPGRKSGSPPNWFKTSTPKTT